jgi:4-hydroxy-3-methylbut-2-enyl diphosphate reductase
VLGALAPADGVEEVFVTDEDEYFPPPRNIRDLQAVLGRAILAIAGADREKAPVLEDRELAASDVLRALSNP